MEKQKDHKRRNKHRSAREVIRERNQRNRFKELVSNIDQEEQLRKEGWWRAPNKAATTE